MCDLCRYPEKRCIRTNIFATCVNIVYVRYHYPQICDLFAPSPFYRLDLVSYFQQIRADTHWSRSGIYKSYNEHCEILISIPGSSRPWKARGEEEEIGCTETYGIFFTVESHARNFARADRYRAQKHWYIVTNILRLTVTRLVSAAEFTGQSAVRNTHK